MPSLWQPSVWSLTLGSRPGPTGGCAAFATVWYRKSGCEQAVLHVTGMSEHICSLLECGLWHEQVSGLWQVPGMAQQD